MYGLVDEGRSGVSVLHLDFNKVFDKISHDILAAKDWEVWTARVHYKVAEKQTAQSLLWVSRALSRKVD